MYIDCVLSVCIYLAVAHTITNPVFVELLKSAVPQTPNNSVKGLGNTIYLLSFPFLKPHWISIPLGSVIYPSESNSYPECLIAVPFPVFYALKTYRLCIIELYVANICTIDARVRTCCLEIEAFMGKCLRENSCHPISGIVRFFSRGIPPLNYQPRR